MIIVSLIEMITRMIIVSLIEMITRMITGSRLEKNLLDTIIVMITGNHLGMTIVNHQYLTIASHQDKITMGYQGMVITVGHLLQWKNKFQSNIKVMCIVNQTQLRIICMDVVQSLLRRTFQC